MDCPAVRRRDGADDLRHLVVHVPGDVREDAFGDFDPDQRLAAVVVAVDTRTRFGRIADVDPVAIEQAPSSVSERLPTANPAT